MTRVASRRIGSCLEENTSGEKALYEDKKARTYGQQFRFELLISDMPLKCKTVHIRHVGLIYR